MAVYMVGYDLNKVGKNYDELITKTKQISNGWWHHLDSTWLINHNGSSVAIRNALTPHLDENDELLVVKLEKGYAAWIGFNTEGSNWLKNNL